MATQADQTLKIEYVPIGQIKHHPKNPRKGDVQAIVESVQENGVYKPIVVQRSTNNCLAGNHTLRALKQLRRKKVACVFLDVDDTQALKIVLADNRTPDLGTYDTAILAEIARDLDGDYSGTGYEKEELDLLISSVLEGSDVGEEELSQIMHPSAFFQAPEDDNRVGGSGDVLHREFGVEDPIAEDDDDDREDEHTFEAASDESSGILELKDDMEFPFVNGKMGNWGIPQLRTDMLMLPSELPANLDTWGGSASRDDPDRETKWWLYNYGIDSTSGMHDPKKMILAFYCFDEYFDPWWYNPARFVTKALNTGIKYALTPNFSMWEEHGRAVWMWSLYRARWLGRYFQEAGIKLIPDICWTNNNMEWLTDYVLDTLPPKVPLISLQLQTMNPQKATKTELKRLELELRAIVKRSKCDSAIIYSARHQMDWVETLKLGPDLIFLPNRMTKLGAPKVKQEGPETL